MRARNKKKMERQDERRVGAINEWRVCGGDADEARRKNEGSRGASTTTVVRTYLLPRKKHLLTYIAFTQTDKRLRTTYR